MANLTRECLEQLKQKVDLVDLLSSYIPMKRSGTYYRACCPFHEEKTPSFVIQAGSSFYHCFGCQAHGDSIAFLMQHQQMSFVEAVESLAERYHILLEYEHQSRPKFNKRRYIEIMQLAHQFYCHALLNLDEGKEALNYLIQRGLDTSFIQMFEVGYAPTNGKRFVQEMLKKKVSMKELKELHLINDSGSSFFFNRITFPIRDARGAVIAFSARLYEETTRGGKYINSKESLLFKKSQVLFGLNYSRMRMAKSKKVLIVEGQIDALKLIQKGFKATIAPLGTALTEQHIDKLKQLGVETAFIAFDSDDAGISAAIKSGNLLQKKGILTFIVNLPHRSDPDQFIRQKGVESFKILLKKRQSYLSFLLEKLSQRVDMTQPANKARVVEKIALEIKTWENAILVHESLKKLAQIAQVPESTLGIDAINIPHIYTVSSHGAKTHKSTPDQLLESDLLAWLLQSDLSNQKLLKTTQKNLSLSSFNDPTCKSIYAILERGLTQNEVLDTLGLLTQIEDNSIQTLIGELLERKINTEQEEELFIQALQRILDRNWMKKREEIKIKIQSGRLDDDEAILLAKQFDVIQKQRPRAIL